MTEESRSSRALQIVIIGVLVTLIGRYLGLSLWLIFLLLAAVLVAGWLFTYWQTWRALDWFRRYNSYSSRVSDGEGAAVLNELTTQRANGDDSPETAFTLAATYNYLGRGQDAEPLALEAFAAIEDSGVCEETDLASRIRCDVTYLTRYDTMVSQGRFVEAASGLRERIRGSIQPNYQTALVTWAYYLGGATEQARAILERVQKPGAKLNNERMLSPRFELIVAYLRHELEDAHTLPVILSHRENIDEWAATAERNAGNPYGAQLENVVAALRTLAIEAETYAQQDPPPVG